jgi:tetratricopeptide (TPR) repeat protein
VEALGRYDEAIEYHKKKLEISQQTGENWPITAQHFVKSNFSSICPLGDIFGEDMAYGNIAAALISLSRYDEAIEYEQEHLEIAQQTGGN